MPPLRAALLLSAITATATSAIAAPAPLAPKAIAQELRNFRTVGTVLHVGAHPDDENTELITYLARGRGFRAAYLSLTRGDGGQNELGRDFDEKLGVLRTHELLAARKLDNGRQFFTRAIDFGYSKTPEETLQFWNRKEVLGDVVRIYRQFRPDVVVTRFPIPPGSGGHGHHTASAILAVEAFNLAGDPKAYPEQLAQGLTVWQPKRVLWNGFRFNADAPLPLHGAILRQDIAGTDAVTGETFGMIAAHSRAMHKTQGLGGFATRARNGANEQTFVLLAGDAPGEDLMDGVDTTWARIPGGADIDALMAKTIADFRENAPEASVPALLTILEKLQALPSGALVDDKVFQLKRILQACLGLELRAELTRAEVVPGDTDLEATFGVKAASPEGVKWTGVANAALGVQAVIDPVSPSQARFAWQNHGARIAEDTPLTHPYWLREDGTEGISRVDDASLIGRSENPPAFPTSFTFEIRGRKVDFTHETLTARNAPDEVVRVVSPVTLAFSSEVFVVGPGRTKPVEVEIAAVRPNTRGTLGLKAPAGWKVSPASQNFELGAAGDKRRVTFSVTSPSSASRGRLEASAEVDEQRFSTHREELRYPHLPAQLLQPLARTRVSTFELAIRGKRIGYLPGAGDYVAECLEQMGYEVRRLTGADLTADKLRDLDAVVIGVRAFNEREDLKENLPGLFEYVEKGGTVVAQYNRPNGLLAQPLAPYELSIEGPAPRLRVTDEHSPYSFISPKHAAVTTPNRLGAVDFEGWVQERGAYFPSKWDESRFEPIIAFNDPGEDPLRSGVLIAKHGKGHYVYTGLAFFRQLPAGVPGAYRLFANLVSLGK